MAGVPVWLVSISRRNLITRRLIATTLWSRQTIEESLALARRVLGPAGNPDRERAFRMNITFCLHRALRPDEVDSLPAYFHTDEAVDIAGGPVAVIWENEVGSASTRPCTDPHRYPIDPRNPLLWAPIDCGSCDPCRARAAIGNLADEQIRFQRARDVLMR